MAWFFCRKVRSGYCQRVLLLFSLSMSVAALPEGVSKPTATSKRASSKTEAESVLHCSGASEYPPIAYRKGSTIEGFSSDVLKEVARKLGLSADVRYEGEWPTVLRLLREGRIDGVCAMYHTRNRDKDFIFSEAYLSDPTVIFVKSQGAKTFQKWSDLKGLRGVAMQGAVYGEPFDAFMKANLEVARVERLEQGFAELLTGQSDYFICGLYPGLWAIEKQGLSERVQRLGTPASMGTLHIALSKKSRHAHLMPQINEVLKRLKEEGWMQGLVERYNLPAEVLDFSQT